jgi:hypothetical protein
MKTFTLGGYTETARTRCRDNDSFLCKMVLVSSGIPGSEPSGSTNRES